MNAIEIMRALIDGQEVDIPNFWSEPHSIRISKDGSKIEWDYLTGTPSESMCEFPKMTRKWREYPCAFNDKGATVGGFGLSFQEAVEAMKNGESCSRSEKPWDIYYMESGEDPMICVKRFNATASYSMVASLNIDEISDRWRVRVNWC